MRTLDELRQAVDQLADSAPPDTRTRAGVLRRLTAEADHAEQQQQQPPARRRRPVALALATVSVVLAAAVVVGVRGSADLTPPTGVPTSTQTPLGPPPHPAGLTWTFDLPDPPSATVFRRLSIAADRQVGLLERPDNGAALTITVHSPGSFDPTRDVRSPRRVRVAGQLGYTGPVGDAPVASLVWPTPDGGWAQLDGWGVDPSDPSDHVDTSAEPAKVLAEQLRVAPMVRFGRYGSPRLPFRLGWLPPDVSAQAVGVHPGTGTAMFSNAGPYTPGVGTIVVARVDTSSSSFAAETDRTVTDRSTLTVGARPAVLGRSTELDARVLAVDLGDGSAIEVLVAGGQVGRYPLGVMQRIVEAADLSPRMRDQDTWVPAPEALGR